MWLIFAVMSATNFLLLVTPNCWLFSFLSFGETHGLIESNLIPKFELLSYLCKEKAEAFNYHFSLWMERPQCGIAHRWLSKLFQFKCSVSATSVFEKKVDEKRISFGTWPMISATSFFAAKTNLWYVSAKCPKINVSQKVRSFVQNELKSVHKLIVQNTTPEMLALEILCKLCICKFVMYNLYFTVVWWTYSIGSQACRIFLAAEQIVLSLDFCPFYTNVFSF